MVRIQLFSLRFSILRKFFPHPKTLKGTRAYTSQTGIRSKLLRREVKLWNSVHFYLSWNAPVWRKRLLPDRLLTRWRYSGADCPAPCLSFQDLSLRFTQTWSFFIFIRSQLGLGVSDRQDGWQLSVAFVNHYIGDLNIRHLEYWRGGQSLQSAPFVHQLRFRFTNSRLTLLFTNPWTRADYFFVSAGIFTRYFFFQKSVKKSKALKLVMARFTRKMIILLDLCNIILLVRGLPFMLENLILTLLSPLRHPFVSPLLGDVFDEVNTVGKSLCISSLVFFNIKPFGFVKTRLKGRIKRKIRRRIHRLNHPDY